MDRCVILNTDYTFLNTVSWKRAVRLFQNGKTEVLKYSSRVIKSAGGSEFIVPSVMRLIKIVRMIYRNKVPFSKRNMLTRDYFKCVYCGTSKKRLTIDHVIPTSKGGKTNFENCVTACIECNNKKKNRTPSEANMFLPRRPTHPTISEFLRIKMKLLGLDKFLEEVGIY